jgi:hypothetical protein
VIWTERREGLLRWVAAAALAAGVLYRIGRAGPLTFEPPRTVVSATQPGFEELIVFLQQIARRLPPGASIAVVPPRQRSELTTPLVFYYLAQGQLPAQKVLYAEVAYFPDGPPDYVASFGTALEDPRLEIVAKLPGGFLYRRAR